VPSNNGMDWIRIAKRMAIYHRDGFTCVWCKRFFEDSKGHGLTLDHVFRSSDNHAENLVTCCHKCNSQRQQKPVYVWLMKVQELHGTPAAEIALDVFCQLGKPLDLDLGKRLAAARRASLRQP
jgi:hypothetical protein